MRPSRLSIRTGYLPLKSRGWVKLRSADPRDPPRIFLNMFAAQGDLEGMVRSLHLSRHIYAQSPLRELIALIWTPSCAIRVLMSFSKALRSRPRIVMSTA